MADWNVPTLTSAYTDFIQELKNRDKDAALMDLNPTNPPVGYIRCDRVTNQRLEWWTGAVWTPIVWGLTGGGTGATTAAGARASLGIGTMGIQDAAAVNITGGTVQGVLQVKGGNMTFDGDGTRDIGTNATKANRVYIKNALVVPVGTDKYATS